MKHLKIRKITLIATLCGMLFATPYFSIQVDAATAPGSETVSPQADVISWVYERRGDEIWKCLYNTTTDEWIGEWIYCGKVGSGSMP